MKTKQTSPVLDMLFGKLRELGADPVKYKFDDTEGREREYRIESYSVAGLVAIVRRDTKLGGYTVETEYATHNDWADNCGFIGRKFDNLEAMLGAFLFTESVLVALRNNLDQLL